MNAVSYTNRQNAIRAARKVFGAAAKPGVEFEISETDGRFAFAGLVSRQAVADEIAAENAKAARIDAMRAAHPERPAVVVSLTAQHRPGRVVAFNVAKVRAAARVDVAKLGAVTPPPAEQPKAPKAPKAAKPLGKRAALVEAAQRGELPPVPDFSAPTHTRFRKKLAEIVAAVEAGDVAALRAFVINPISTSPKAMAKYRDLAVVALEARAARGD